MSQIRIPEQTRGQGCLTGFWRQLMKSKKDGEMDPAEGSRQVVERELRRKGDADKPSERQAEAEKAAAKVQRGSRPRPRFSQGPSVNQHSPARLAIV
jgi:hypothetical protein